MPIKLRNFALLQFLLSASVALPNDNVTKSQVRYFPTGFLFGTTTSAYQIEGAWNEDGRTESIWDRLVHTKPSVIKDQSTGDEANDSYHLYKRDVQMVRELGVDFYRFSISWSRILPTSFPNKINKPGEDYYNNLINELLKYNIQPVITLYHWDLPQKLQDLGGWTNPLIVDWYADYARVAFSLFGDRVKYWITINEPDLICHYSYAEDYWAPNINSKGIGEYLCAKNVLLAHATAYHIYEEEFRETQLGKIFISIIMPWYEPESPEHALAAEECFQFNAGQYAHPIFSQDGDWPPVMKSKIGAKSAAQGFPRSRLPSFSTEEINFIRGTSDFFGLNHYNTYVAYRNATSNNFEVPSRDDDVGVSTYVPYKWKYSKDAYVTEVPWGFTKVLKKIMEDYDNPPLIVTEIGFATQGGLNDSDRVKFIHQYLDALLDAIDAGANVIGYAAWSLMDNFEWIKGYTLKFGLYEVDYTSPQRTRTPRQSAFVYKQIVRTRALDPLYVPDATTMTIDEGH